MKKVLWLGTALLVALAACTSGGYFKTRGDLKILASEPPLDRCVLRAGDYFTLKGNDFGAAEDWENGTNYLILPEELPAPVELTRPKDPATLQAGEGNPRCGPRRWSRSGSRELTYPVPQRPGPSGRRGAASPAPATRGKPTAARAQPRPAQGTGGGRTRLRGPAARPTAGVRARPPRTEPLLAMQAADVELVQEVGEGVPGEPRGRSQHELLPPCADPQDERDTPEELGIELNPLLEEK